MGAGLPIIGTLKHLLETGDKAQLVEGVFSGTLSFIFNTFGDGRPFSEIVKDAKAQVRGRRGGSGVVRCACVLRLFGQQACKHGASVESVCPHCKDTQSNIECDIESNLRSKMQSNIQLNKHYTLRASATHTSFPCRSVLETHQTWHKSVAHSPFLLAAVVHCLLLP